MHSESSSLWISAFATFLSHRKGWRHRWGSHPFRTLIFKNRTETKYQRITCKYTTYSKKSNDTGLAFNYLINQSIDIKGLYHMVFLLSLFYCKTTTLQAKIYFTFLSLCLHAFLLLFPQSGMSLSIFTPSYSAFRFLSVLQGQGCMLTHFKFILQFLQLKISLSFLLSEISYFIIWFTCGVSYEQIPVLIYGNVEDIKMGVLR